MTSLLSSHLNQISTCADSIADLPFPGPKIFTNALLSSHDITALIRDTEQHERALFHLAPPPLPPKTSATDFGASVQSATAATQGARRATAYGGRQPKSKAVAAVLGGELYKQTRRPEGNRQKGDLDVEVLLEGAEKLASVYPIEGALERIEKLRQRHEQLQANIKHYEARVTLQQRELERMKRPGGQYEGEDDETGEMEAEDMDTEPTANAVTMTKEDLEREQEEVRELERKKKGLEERVTGMERDLGGLMR